MKRKVKHESTSDKYANIMHALGIAPYFDLCWLSTKLVCALLHPFGSAKNVPIGILLFANVRTCAIAIAIEKEIAHMMQKVHWYQWQILIYRRLNKYPNQLIRRRKCKIDGCCDGKQHEHKTHHLHAANRNEPKQSQCHFNCTEISKC